MDQDTVYRNYTMFSDTLCFQTPPIFHRTYYFLDAQKHVFHTPLVFRHPYFSPKWLFFSVRKHRVITVMNVDSQVSVWGGRARCVACSWSTRTSPWPGRSWPSSRWRTSPAPVYPLSPGRWPPWGTLACLQQTCIPTITRSMATVKNTRVSATNTNYGLLTIDQVDGSFKIYYFICCVSATNRINGLLILTSFKSLYFICCVSATNRINGLLTIDLIQNLLLHL